MSNLGPSAMYLLQALRGVVSNGPQPLNENLAQQQNYQDLVSELSKLNPNAMQNLQQAKLLRQLQSASAAKSSPMTMAQGDEYDDVPSQP